MQNSELLDFTGGMNTVVAPHLLPLNECLELINVDLRLGSLKSITELDNTSTALNKYFVEYRSKLYFYPEWRSNAEIDDKLYWADGVDSGKILPDGTELPLGIPTPTVALTQAPSGVVDEGTHKGDYKYTYTFYSSTTGIESAPAPLPSYVTVDEQNILLSSPEALPVPVPGEPAIADRYRIYRIGGYLTRFTLVDTLELAQFPYIDSLDETLIDGRLLQTLRTGTPPPGINNLVELNGRLFGSVGNKLYFSGLGNPDAWYSDDFFNMPDTITGLAKSPAGIIVMGRRYTELLFGAAPSSFRRKVISDYLGCVSNKSISYYREKVLWLGEFSILSSDGYGIQDLTSDRINRISSMDVNSSSVANDIYYLSFKPTMVPNNDLYPSDDLLPGGIQGGDVTGDSEGLIALDFKRGRTFSYSYLNYANAISVGIHNSELYLVLDGDLTPISCTATIPCDEVFCLGSQVLAKLGGTLSDAYKPVKYLSPTLIDGSASTLKEYDKVRINFIGVFKITVLLSNLNVTITETISSESLVNNEIDLRAAQDKLAIIGIPNNNNKSYSIQFLVEGYGEVKSIQYSWKNRELP